MNAGDHLTLQIEKPAAGGRMIARHDGAVLLVSGAIPGETVEADIERVQRGTAWARTRRVLHRSPDRRNVEGDGACGGNVLAHVAYERQRALKGEIIQDAFARIGRMTVPPVDVMGSPERGYRMRARLHIAGGRMGFFREGTHELCDPATTGQLLPDTMAVLRAAEATLKRDAPGSVAEVEVNENCAADQRALHLILRDDAEPSRLRSLQPIAGVRGITCGTRPGGRPLLLWGDADVSDTLSVHSLDGPVAMTLTRHAHSFFQGNRYLLTPLVDAVIGETAPGRVVDLYAGVGLFAVALAAGGHDVTAIEGDRAAAEDLKVNAARLGGRIESRHESVEAYLRTARGLTPDTLIVDPPRTGMTKEAIERAIALRPARLVYVSCDVATLARDARTIVHHGYRLGRIRAFDLFPNTAHVETLVVFDN